MLPFGIFPFGLSDTGLSSMPTPEINTDVSLDTATQEWYIAGDGTVYGPYPGPIKEFKRSRTYKPVGVSTPLPAPGEPRFTTDWYREKRSYNTGALGCLTQYPGVPGTFRSSGGLAYNASLMPLRPWKWDMRGRTINGALANLKDQKIDLSVAFGERKETARYFSTNIDRVTDLYRDLKRRKRGVWDYMKNFRVDRNSSRLDQIPKAWLETQYAVKPLVQDAFGAIDKLNKLERSPNAYFFVTKKSAEENWSGDRDDLGFCYAGGAADAPLVVNYREVDRAHTSLVYRLRNPLTRELANLGITNPLSTAYELMTFSFVLDWAVPVGDYLNLLDADFGWDFLTGSTMLSQRSNGSGRFFKRGSSLVVEPYSGPVEQIRFDNFAMFREVHHTSPWPVYPTIRNPLSNSTRVSSALALLKEVFT